MVLQQQGSRGCAQCAAVSNKTQMQLQSSRLPAAGAAACNQQQEHLVLPSWHFSLQEQGLQCVCCQDHLYAACWWQQNQICYRVAARGMHTTAHHSRWHTPCCCCWPPAPAECTTGGSVSSALGTVGATTRSSISHTASHILVACLRVAIPCLVHTVQLIS